MLRALKETRFVKIFNSFRKKRSSEMSVQVETATVPEVVPGTVPEMDLRLNKRSLMDENDSEILAKQPKINDSVRIKRRNYAMMLSYLGKEYYGMQRNRGIKTIEEDLISALYKSKLITDEAFEAIRTVHFQRAARTDKGVSATRQIVNLKMPEEVSIESVNEYLPEVIRVFGLKRVTKGFNSKSQCDARSYTYTLPSFAFAPDDPSILRNGNGLCSDTDILEREKSLMTIDGKPYTEFRLNNELNERINSVLKLFEGTHNYHNFTSKVRPFDPRANRYIIKFESSEPYVSQGMEYVTLKVKGQSFMLHQIRKMVALAIGVVRNLTPEETINEAFKHERMDIPIAPSLGLVLNHVHYENYNKRYGSDGLHEALDWSESEDQVMKFHRDYILRHIEDTEVEEKSMLLWLVSLAKHTYGVRDQHVVPEENAISQTA